MISASNFDFNSLQLKKIKINQELTKNYMTILNWTTSQISFVFWDGRPMTEVSEKGNESKF